MTDYYKKLVSVAQRADAIDVQFPGALEAFIASADDLEFEPITDIGYGRDNLHMGAKVDVAMDYVDFWVTDENTLVASYDKRRPKYDWMWDNDSYEWLDPRDVSVEVKEPETCPDCGGAGKWQGLLDWNTCKTCGGTGKVSG